MAPFLKPIADIDISLKKRPNFQTAVIFGVYYLISLHTMYVGRVCPTASRKIN
jgi:hypothetical protein